MVMMLVLWKASRTKAGSALQATQEPPQPMQPIQDQGIKECFYGRNSGFRIESAYFAAHGDEPTSVAGKVRRRIRDGHQTVPVSWHYLTDGKDPHEYQEKHLTVAFSVTQREHGGREVLLPSGWFLKTLDDLVLDLKRIQQMDKDGRIATLDTDNWMTQVDALEDVGRKARTKLQLLRTLADLVVVDISQFDRLDNLKLLHEAEELQQALKPSLGEAR